MQGKLAVHVPTMNAARLCYAVGKAAGSRVSPAPARARMPPAHTLPAEKATMDGGEAIQALGGWAYINETRPGAVARREACTKIGRRHVPKSAGCHRPGAVREQ